MPEWIYLDNNATTIVPDHVVNTVTQWMNKGNASSSYGPAKECQKLITTFRDLIAAECDISLDGVQGYSIIFTSGASESNSHIITATARGYMFKTGLLPHVIVSAVEHKSILMCCERLKKEKLIELTEIPVQTKGPYLGTVDPVLVEQAIKPNTCLISIMTTNNETGANNNIVKIGQIAADRHVPFHTDVVQIFGRSKIKPVDLNIDAMSISFHKIYGPPGIGVLIVKNSFIAGYDLPPLIYGTQNYGLRGGTINTPAIAGAFAGLKYTLEKRAKKNVQLREFRELIMTKIARKVSCCYLEDYVERSNIQVVWIAPKAKGIVVPWTILLAVDKPSVCNIKLKNALEKRGIIVSIGSACNTSDAKASHVVYALGLSQRLKPGVLRVSMGYDTTRDDVNAFINAFLALILR